MRDLCRFLAACAAAGIAATAAAACGGSGDATPTAVASPGTAVISPTATPGATGAGSATAPGGAAAASPTTMPPTGGASTPAPRVSDEDGARAAVRAAYPSAGFAPGCAADATGKTCITTNWTADTLRGGIGCVSLASAESAVLHCFARKADGTWTYWVTIANGGGGPVRALPGDAIVCANGDGLNLRAEPSTTAQKITLLPDGSTVHLDEFVLTEPGPFSGDPRQHGDGWYHVATPQQGWAYDRFLVPASDGGCRRNWWP